MVRFRFGIRSILLVTLLVCIGLWGGPRFYEWYRSIPLSQEVASFNARAATDSIGEHEPPISEAEIVKTIEAKLPTLNAGHKVESIYARIIRTRRLPRGAQLDYVPGYSPANGRKYSVWWVNLNVPTGKNRGYALRIRENNNTVSDANGPRYTTAKEDSN